MNIIIDTNLWISFIIGKKLSVMRTLFTNPKVKIYVCDELLNEITNVSSRLKMQRYITDEDIQETHKLIETCCRYISISKSAISSVRDKKDLYLLSLAETIPADFILTGDKDLLSLQSHHQIRIVTYNEFTAILSE